jgi:N-acyl homoserine lactone hydrolase
MYTIKPLLLSTVETNRSMMTYTLYFNKTDSNPMVSWYINANGKHILVDTGISVEEHKKIANVPMNDVQSFEAALQNIGLKPEDIDIVIQTHLHYDHCANTSKCTNATVVVQEKELMFAYSHDPVFHHLYVRKYFEGLNYRLIDGKMEIVPGIEVIPMTGHTPGCQAVSVKTPQGLAVISGVCAIKENFFPPPKLASIWPVLIPTFHIDAKKSFYDLLYIKHLADILIPQHDIGFASMKEIPANK